MQEQGAAAAWWTDEVRPQHKVAIVRRAAATAFCLTEFHLHLTAWHEAGWRGGWGRQDARVIYAKRGMAAASLHQQNRGFQQDSVFNKDQKKLRGRESSTSHDQGQS